MKHDIKTVKGFLDYVYNFYTEMRNYEINIMYEGKITHQITKAFTTLTEVDLEEREESGKVRRKVFHVMVESLQNITKHATPAGDNKQSVGRGIFVVSKGEDYYSVITGNLVSKDQSNELKKMLDHINSKDVDELKQMYKRQIKEGRKLSEKGGAGLGFIDIARKTGNKIEYNIVPVDDESNSFFILAVKIDIK